MKTKREDKKENGLPVAWVGLHRSFQRQYFYWRVYKCPFCGEGHLHGGGESPEDARVWLSPRLSHCRNGDEYTLREIVPSAH